MRIGRVGRPHGTAGAFTVSEPSARGGLFDAGRTVAIAGRSTKVSWRKGTPEHPIVKVEGVDDREGARGLAGAEIMVPREALAPLEPGEHLVDDLIGMVVVDGGRMIGKVVDVLVLPSVEALEVERESGAPLLVPLVRNAVRSIDTERRVIDVDTGFVEGEDFGG